MAGIHLPMMVNARSEVHLLGVPMSKTMVFHRADREIKPKKLMDFDWASCRFQIVCRVSRLYQREYQQPQG